MVIKVVVNYPKTEEGLQHLKELQAQVVARSLIRMLSEVQLDEVVSELTQSLVCKAV